MSSGSSCGTHTHQQAVVKVGRVGFAQARGPIVRIAEVRPVRTNVRFQTPFVVATAVGNALGEELIPTGFRREAQTVDIVVILTDFTVEAVPTQLQSEERTAFGLALCRHVQTGRVAAERTLRALAVDIRRDIEVTVGKAGKHAPTERCAVGFTLKEVGTQMRGVEVAVGIHLSACIRELRPSPR